MNNVYSQMTPLPGNHSNGNIHPFNNFMNSFSYQILNETHVNINRNIPIIHEHDTTGGWFCNSCGLINNVIEKCCDIEYKWNCEDCNTLNSSHLIKCENCNEIRKWMCEVCDTTNIITTHTCINCLTNNPELIKWTCEECNETAEIRSRFVCSNCNESRTCQCNDCIGTNLFIPFSFFELMDSDSDNEVDLFELEDVEINNGLTTEQLEQITKIYWTNDIKIDTCIICFCQFNNNDQIYQLKCNDQHCFHTSCLDIWFEKKNTCPICRYEL